GAAVVVGVTIGSAIYQVPAPIAAGTGNLLGVSLVWIVGGLISLFGVLSIAGTHAVAAALVVLISAAQYRSVRLGALVQNLSTGTKLIALVGLAAALLLLAPHAGANLAGASEGSLKWNGLAVALVASLWAYDGWANLTPLAGEMREPQRNLPRAFIGGALLVMGIYLLMNAAFLVALPFGELSASKAVAADAVTAVLGHGGTVVIALLVMVSTFGSLNGSIMSDPRVFYAMAEDGLFFKSVGKVHPRFETPHVAIAFSAVLAVVYVLFRDYLQLAAAYVLGIWPFLALSTVGLFVLRRKQPDLPRSYKAFGYPVVPALFVLGTFLVIGGSLYFDPVSTGISIGVTLIGLPIYWLWLRFKKA